MAWSPDGSAQGNVCKSPGKIFLVILLSRLVCHMHSQFLLKTNILILWILFDVLTRAMKVCTIDVLLQKAFMDDFTKHIPKEFQHSDHVSTQPDIFLRGDLTATGLFVALQREVKRGIHLQDSRQTTFSLSSLRQSKLKSKPICTCEHMLCNKSHPLSSLQRLLPAGKRRQQPQHLNCWRSGTCRRGGMLRLHAGNV